MKRLPHIRALAALLLRAPIANADTGTGLSGNVSMDTRGTASANTVTVTGRVWSQTSGAALPGAMITLAGRSTATGSNGSFSLANVDLSAGPTLAVSLTSYLSQSQTGSPGAGPQYSTSFHVDALFTPSLQVGRNKVAAGATSAGGVSSMQTSIAVVVLPVPSTLAAFLIDPANIGNDGKKLSGKLKWPEPAVRKTVTLPPLASEILRKLRMTGFFQTTPLPKNRCSQRHGIAAAQSVSGMTVP